MKKYFSMIAVVSAIGFWSCDSGKNKQPESNSLGNFEFEKLDSVQVNLLGNPVLADAAFGKILLFETKTREFIVLDQKSEIQSRFILSEDSPEHFGFPLLLPAFLTEDQVIIPGTKGIFIYDLQGNLKTKLRHPEALSGSTFTDFPGYSIEPLWLANQPKILSKSFRTYDSYIGEKEFYPRFRGIELLNLQDSSSKAWIPFPENSRFLDGNGYIQSDFEPYFGADEQGIYLAFAGEPWLHRYAWLDDSLKFMETLPLDLPEFSEIKGKPIEQLEGIGVSTNLSTAAIRKITSWNDLILVTFYPGLSTEQSESISIEFQKGNREEAMAKMKTILADRKMGMAIVDKNSFNQIGIIRFPPWVNANGFVLDGDDFWFQKAFNPEQEEDFLKIYKVKLIEK